MNERKMTFKAVLSLFLVHLMDNPDKLNIGRAQSNQNAFSLIIFFLPWQSLVLCEVFFREPLLDLVSEWLQSVAPQAGDAAEDA